MRTRWIFVKLPRAVNFEGGLCGIFVKRVGVKRSEVATSGDLEAERGGFDAGRVPSLGRNRVYVRNLKVATKIRLVILDHP